MTSPAGEQLTGESALSQAVMFEAERLLGSQAAIQAVLPRRFGPWEMVDGLLSQENIQVAHADLTGQTLGSYESQEIINTLRRHYTTTAQRALERFKDQHDHPSKDERFPPPFELPDSLRAFGNATWQQSALYIGATAIETSISKLVVTSWPDEDAKTVSAGKLFVTQSDEVFSKTLELDLLNEEPYFRVIKYGPKEDRLFRMLDQVLDSQAVSVAGMLNSGSTYQYKWRQPQILQILAAHDPRLVDSELPQLIFDRTHAIQMSELNNYPLGGPYRVESSEEYLGRLAGELAEFS